MNFVFLSPDFPPNYRNFCQRLRDFDVNVLGLGDSWHDGFSPALKGALTEYYRAANMLSYDELVRALGYFTHRYGKLDRVESLNEFWLETEARLRTDFNVPGFKTADLPWFKRKSEMKSMFAKAGVECAPGRLVRTPAQAIKAAGELGFPVVAKPDVGVGATLTYKIASEQELDDFARQLNADYMLEAYIAGAIQTFDGLTDQHGHIVFYTSHQYSKGVMEVVNEDDDVYYYSLRQIPPDIEQAGRSIVRAYGIAERFFHFEFFRTPEGKLVALEVNMRPPGGMTTDMFNYANDIDIYHEWANVVVNNRFESAFSWPYHCCFVGRKSTKRYRHSHDEILAAWGEHIAYHQPMMGVFRQAMGDYGYLVRSPDLDEIVAMAGWMQEKG